MDASAYLKRHGWTGAGLGYRQNGIKKPILASQKRGFQGIGGKPIGGQSDQWWLGAFDISLKNLGTNEASPMKVSVTRNTAYFKSELYRNFVKGDGLDGTIEALMSASQSHGNSSLDAVIEAPQKRVSDNSIICSSSTKGSKPRHNKRKRRRIEDEFSGIEKTERSQGRKVERLE